VRLNLPKQWLLLLKLPLFSWQLISNWQISPLLVPSNSIMLLCSTSSDRQFLLPVSMIYCIPHCFWQLTQVIIHLQCGSKLLEQGRSFVLFLQQSCHCQSDLSCQFFCMWASICSFNLGFNNTSSKMAMLATACAFIRLDAPLSTDSEFPAAMLTTRGELGSMIVIMKGYLPEYQ
jgi:membrane-associated HD superfamily phosphohydrolase